MAFVHRSFFVVLVLLCGFIGYLVLGAVIFAGIENKYEKAEINKLINLRRSFLENNPCVTDLNRDRGVLTKTKPCKRKMTSKYGSVDNNNSKLQEQLQLPVYITLEHVTTRKINCGFSSTSGWFTMYLLFYLFFLFTGSIVFSTLETPEEQALISSVISARQHFDALYPNVKDEDLENLIAEVVRASNRGVSAAKNVSNPPNWSFGQSLFFSTTVVTTIGYGHVTPLSRSGKLFCIMYAMCGIPLTLVLMSALVDKLLKPTLWFQHWLLKHLGNLYQPLHIKLLHLMIIVLLLVIFLLTIPAFIFASIETEWDFLDSFYYCFISLTTIGLGDYIPGDDRNQTHRAAYKILTSCYLLVGLTFMMLTLALFYEIPQLNIGLLFKAHEDIDSEKARLATYGLGLQYGIDAKTDSEDNTHRQVVRVRSRQRDDSPSPEEPPINQFMKP